MDQGPGYPHGYMPPPQQFPYHPSPYPFGAPSTTPLQPPQGIVPQGFFNPWEPPPPPVPPPSDSDLHKRIDKLVEYAAKNGPQFEQLMKDKQKDNVLYSFLFGAEGHSYYRYKLWVSINPHIAAINPALAQVNPNLAPLNPSLAAINPSLNAVPAPVPGTFPGSFYDPQQQHAQPFFDQFQHDAYGQYNAQHANAPSGPLPPEILVELKGVLDGLTGTKESIKGAKTWFMQRASFAPALAEAMRDRVLSLDDVERQLHVIYLANDILFNSLQHRSSPTELDNEALAFRPVLGSMLAAIYHNRQTPEANQGRLQKILQFWGGKEVFDTDTINSFEGEMVAGPPPPTPDSFTPMQTSTGGVGPVPSGSAAATAFQFGGQWQAEQLRTAQAATDQQPQDQPQAPFGNVLPNPPPFFGASVQFTPAGAPQFVAGSAPPSYPILPGPPFLAPLPTPPPQNVTPALAQLPTLRSADQPPYPLFPPGLIPGMVRKMQIGSGVPYSPLSPLDIPTVIPPSTTSESYILERVTKFFKEIGEVDPLEGQFKGSESAGGENEGEEGGGGREGGARIPPPGHMQVDPDTGTLPDGSVEHRPGVGSTGRLGLGAVADPNEATQYDDVYTSYRKQRSTNYHTSLSARAAAAR
ncbi:hypothetical protein MPTK1_5g20260 [Marchantia polymorpha subsp. ruderalis]|uniref:CID domain-containing protein n=2 Tax=Marchantia polymorpha TaxID=3197 RepID=A0A176WAM3_MARPO|nr:hypothetical protein AXG93_509s1030 [Marchantia polymorpha subsp. ruderalis]PTQ37211.1 hypothetical protein MARPO_0058s0003 [Marchantia polymorpha]BBN12459.1 hypothetical protein Mp_5g20260 [Marchantia polymorpha subsp. ruderalis]|eukprot:PTQ37211.1 hypothetical protein MARPO_0058s0003 [Marchantia polymorpha]